MNVLKNKILVIILLVFSICFIGCKKELPEPNAQGISATSTTIEKALKHIIVDSSYKRLTNNLRLPLEADGKYLIKWSVSENDYASIKLYGEDSVLVVKRHDTEYIKFELIAAIESEDGRDYGVRTWVCYIAPKIYR